MRCYAKKTKLNSLVMIVFLILSILTINCHALPLPTIKQQGDDIFTRKKQRKLSQAYLMWLKNHLTMVSDPIASHYLQSLGNKLVSASDKNQNKYHFFFVADNSLNAFAGPGGNIAVNTGMILATDTEAQLAAVLSHEITHLNQHHLERMIADKKRHKIPTLAALIAAALIGSKAPNVASGAVAATMASNVQHQINFTRQNEWEADRLGMSILYTSGYDPYSMPEVFEHLQTDFLHHGIQISPFLMTHPVTRDRIADALNHANQFPKRSYHDHDYFYFIKERLRAMTMATHHEAIDYYETKLKNNKAVQHLAALKYGYAVALLRAEKYPKARKVIKELLNDEDELIIFRLTQANIEIEAEHYKKAITILRKASNLYPENYPVMLYYSHALLKAGHPEQARKNILQYLHENPQADKPYGLLAECQSQSGHLSDAYQTQAEVLLNYGNTAMALRQLRIAEELPDLDERTKTILQAKIVKLQEKEKK